MGKLTQLVVLLQGCIVGLFVALPAVCQAQDMWEPGSLQPAGDLYLAGATLDRVAGTVSWYQDLPGDYDQNGEVNLADISALIRHFGEYSKDGWSFVFIQSVHDGDHNNEINLADITTIVLNYGLTITSFELFQSNSLADQNLFNGAGILEVPYSISPGIPLDMRRRFEVQVPIGPSPFLYIAAANQAGLVGTAHFVYEVWPHPPRLYSPYYGLTWDAETESIL